MFYISGVFFPLERLPAGVQLSSWALPLTPAAALVRGFVAGDPSWTMLLWAAELFAMGVWPSRSRRSSCSGGW